MKTFLFFNCLLISTTLMYSQHGSYFFPPDTVFEYIYEATPLDTNSNPISAEMFYRSDLFFDIADYQGKQANIFLTKEAPTLDSLNNQPYWDSLFFHYDGTDGYEYFQTDPLEEFLIALDSMNIDPNFGFLNFFRSLEDWYSLYRFSATLNDEYNLLTVDTVVAGFNARFEYVGERFPDEVINTTHHGNINCKKFLISWRVSVFFITWIELLSTEDSLWISPGEEFWMVQEIVPTNYVDLSFLGIDPFYIYGVKINDPLIVSVEDELESNTPTEFSLEQNYPNPFNPSTTIRYKTNNTQFVSLKVYDVIGNEIAELVNEEKPAGVYNVEWNASGFTSGVYFYQLSTEGFVETKKMILMK